MQENEELLKASLQQKGEKNLDFIFNVTDDTCM